MRPAPAARRAALVRPRRRPTDPRRGRHTGLDDYAGKSEGERSSFRPVRQRFVVRRSFPCRIAGVVRGSNNDFAGSLSRPGEVEGNEGVVQRATSKGTFPGPPSY
jgi:hypothetical protein